MSWTVKTPVEGFTGEVAGVVFDNGIGTCTTDVSYFLRHGYTVEQDRPKQAKPTASKK